MIMAISSRSDAALRDPIRTLHDFYAAMWFTRDVRRRMTAAILAGKDVLPDDIDCLQRALAALEAIPRTDDGATLALDESVSLALDLSYETGELVKDIRYLTDGEEAFLSSLEEIHDDFAAQTRRATDYLRERRPRTIISDRDGTINNYCGRYVSSIQSVYNAVFLTRCARRLDGSMTVLTSAPLAGGGLVDIAVAPDTAFVYAGSKGREYQRPDGERGAMPVAPAQAAKMDELNRALESLLQEPAYRKFTLIGSGFQKKFGQTTISRQDITGSIAPDASRHFLEIISGQVSAIDPAGEFFRIEDTGKDIEIMLTVKDASGGVRDFDKGDGVLFLDKELELGLARGHNVICGDTPSDVPMATAALRASADVGAVFVTRDQSLASRVRAAVPDAVIVTEPDALVVALYQSTNQ
jgi:hypothetical protein